ncbi:hypothetical protein Pmar_PMAR019907 [Perkinsus marinus ATCC 50983]|nr:hypothetical protein Pmar_PMAR019907 [Perkinsus marinus ATCC 50983]EER18024.1 hypothetical protein Pmar_PMAR019907 [Perkinsus marinus ATCC 50983]|eukprot:XP_002786228.1 hypothetical protein Pmar_PMAR019907 [Perkinsus marinus ATCC 50983]
MLARLSEVIPGRLRFFGPVELSMLCSGLMRLRYYNEKLLRRIADEVPHRLPVLEPSHIGQIIYAFSVLGFRDQMLYVDIADDVMRRIRDFTNPIELLQVIKALAKAEVMLPGLWECLVDAGTSQWEEIIRGDIPSVAVQYLAAVASIDGHLVARGYPSANTQDFASAMCTVLLEKGNQLDLSLAARAIGSLGKLHRYNEQVWSPLLENVMSNIDHLQPDQISQVSLGLSSAGRGHPMTTPLIAALSARAISIVDDYDVWCAANTMQGFAGLGKRDVKLFGALAKHLAKNDKLLEDATPQGLASVLHSMAKVMIKSDIFLYIMANLVISKISAFEGQALGMVLYAYGRLNCYNEALVRACIKQLRAIINDLNLVSIHMISDGLKALGALSEDIEALLKQRVEDLGHETTYGVIDFDDDAEDAFDIAGEEAEEDPLTDSVQQEVVAAVERARVRSRGIRGTDHPYDHCSTFEGI